ncbi:TRAP transporter small permease [Aestuariispira insulae]|uniref:TRAP transporter small permease protein n=1 Tax=Aestuariispira insulae TaxID=1461337 RepID=A0A3D9H8C9_9PROT|nr:TRAP transporter small permease [Aestuariispira insulae]RED45762.1 TRAP-type C4-dicarboxylate transport system permease small subunit [Aestuariispira insulae]
MFDRFHRLLFLITRAVAWIGMLFLLGAMFVTTADIILRKINTEGIFGTIDLVQLMIVAAAYLSIPHAFMTKSHVAVTILSDRMPARLAALTGLVGMGLSCAFMFSIAWFGYDQAAMQHEYGDISQTLGVPLIYYWIPLLFGAGLAAFVTLVLSLEFVVGLLTGGDESAAGRD